MKYFLLLALTLLSASVWAWTPPSTVKVIVGQSPGGGNEFAFRGIQPILEKNAPLVNFIFDYRPGMDNVIAMNHFSSQPADGSAILVVVQTTGFVTAPVAYKSQLKSDPINYSFVTTLARAPMAFVVKDNSEFKTVPQLLAHLKQPGNQFNIGISGGINLLAYSYFIDQLGVSEDLVQKINFKSPTEATVAVAGGQIDMAIVPMSVPKPLIDAGKVRILAHTGSAPVPGQESVALMRNHMPKFVLESAWSVFLPPGTPKHINDWYVKEIVKAVKNPIAKQYYNTNWASIDSAALGPDGLANSISKLRSHWLPIAQQIFKEEK
jgi:tripartite-type tricarboxylate transporter receptor subunit TctC